MKIVLNALFTVPRSQTGAVLTVTEALFSHLVALCAAAGDTISILASRTNAEYWARICPSVELIIIPWNTGRPLTRVATEQLCRPVLKRQGADVFYSSSGALPLIQPSCPTAVYLQNILFFHFEEFYSQQTLGASWAKWQLYYRAQDWYSRKACYRSLNKATEVLAVSNTMAREAELNSGLVRRRPIRMVPYGVSDVFGKPGPRLDRSRPYVVAVSNLVPHKNYEDCLHLFARFKHDYAAPHELVLLGTGPAEYVAFLKELARTLEIENAVDFHGYVTHDDLPAWYASADALVMTSSCESFGLPIIEAMASGTPALVSDRSGLPETAGGAAVVEDPSRWDQFAEHLHAVVSDSAYSNRLRELGRARAAEFTWPKTAQRTLEILRSTAR